MRININRTTNLKSPAFIKMMIFFITFLFSTSAFSHHGFGGRYDPNRTVELVGELVEKKWKNPHVRLTIKDKDGQLWSIEAGSPTVMLRRGIVEDLVKLGDQLKVAGLPSVRGRNEMTIDNILLTNGKEIVLDPKGTGPRWQTKNLIGDGDFLTRSTGDASAPELGIFRVWMTVSKDPASKGIYPEARDPSLAYRYPLTESALAYLKSFNPATDNPIEAYCLPKGMPMVMDQPFPMEFTDHGDTIVARLEEYDTVRTIHMGDDRPKATEHSSLGYSSGRWEGETLVVSSTHINWPYFSQMGIRQSKDVSIEERFTPSKDGSRLDYELKATDPKTFTKPVVLRKYWIWDPSAKVVKFDCTE